MSSKLCFIDFEYRGSAEEKLDLVSCSLKLVAGNKVSTATYWLFKDIGELEHLKYRLRAIKEDYGYIMVAWAVTAEASSFCSLGLNPIDFEWIDLYLEYRCLTNHNDNFMYGKQLIDGKKKVTKRPKNKWSLNEEQRSKASMQKPQHNLAAGCYKILGKVIDTDFKDAVRDIIINGTDEEIIEAKDEILRYNESDIDYLPELLEGIKKEYARLLRHDKAQYTTLRDEMLKRGEYAARTAVMERRGYPIDYERTLNFSKSVNDILWSLQSEINGLFPTIQPFSKKRDRTYSWSHVRTREWIDNSEFRNQWLQTEKGKHSLKLDAFKEHFNYRHDYPKYNFGAQMVRYLSTRRNLNGFLQSDTAKKKGTFWDYCGSDNRVRPYFGIYGSQSARSQPKATGFLFLKSAWMRALCVPQKGRAVAGIDYKSQEFLVAALLSKDENMIKAYESGDPYLYLAKLAGAVPWEGTKAEYPEERNIFKVVTLALQYGMGPVSLSNELTMKLGKPFSQAKAKKLINLFNRSYAVHYRWKEKAYREYKRKKYSKLPCGWYMWGDNDNEKSAKNFPVQGAGSSIMRDAVGKAQDAGLDVIKTLHDALYIEYDVGNENDMVILGKCMQEAFKNAFREDIRHRANIGLDGNCWSPDYEEGYFNVELLGKVKKQKTYIDERSVNEYENFKKYFEYKEFDL
jgi:hypothetical protein